MVNRSCLTRALLLFTLIGANAAAIGADQSSGVHRLNISDTVHQNISALPEEYQAFLFSDRLFFASLPGTDFVKLLEGKTTQELKREVQELMWLDSKLSIRTAADTSKVDLKNLGHINDQLDDFIAD
jgi:hypothetical protein